MKFSVHTYTYPNYTQVKSCRFVCQQSPTRIYISKVQISNFVRATGFFTEFPNSFFSVFTRKFPDAVPKYFTTNPFTSRQNTLCGHLIKLYSVQTVQLRENYYTTWKLQCINTNIYTYIYIYTAYALYINRTYRPYID
jgi:hypothetical protein